jgi:hypothetical protein
LASGYNNMGFPLTAAFPASESRRLYFYIGERERDPVFPDLCNAERDLILSS